MNQYIKYAVSSELIDYSTLFTNRFSNNLKNANLRNIVYRIESSHRDRLTSFLFIYENTKEIVNNKRIHKRGKHKSRATG